MRNLNRSCVSVLVLAGCGLFAPGTVLCDTTVSADTTHVVSAEVVKSGKAVEIRMSQGVKTIAPGKDETDFAGFDNLLISPDRQSVAWIESQGGAMSDASYPEATGVWLFSYGKVRNPQGCDGGRPSAIRFDATGRTMIITCDFAHGPDQTHEVSFDSASGKCVSNLDVQSGARSKCPSAD